MCKLAHVIRYTVLSQYFHFCCFRAMAYIRLWNWVQFCLFNICGFISYRRKRRAGQFKVLGFQQLCKKPILSSQEKLHLVLQCSEIAQNVSSCCNYAQRASSQFRPLQIWKFYYIFLHSAILYITTLYAAEPKPLSQRDKWTSLECGAPDKHVNNYSGTIQEYELPRRPTRYAAVRAVSMCVVILNMIVWRLKSIVVAWG